jgi:uncharacterized membrane protein
MPESKDVRRELAELREILREVTARIYRVERTLQDTPVEVEAPRQQVRPTQSEGGEAAISSASRVTIPAHERLHDEPTSDLETRIGSHWLNRIGISAVLIGVAYFLKFAFDNNWIGASGRVVIGILAGVGVVLWSERFRVRGYRAFSFSLKAVGIGALYLSFWAAFQVYALIPVAVAFIAMFMVTAATAVMALTQDAQVLAAFALTGGFATPILLSTGQNREWQLFSYVLLLDVATLFLLVLKPWRRLLFLSFGGTLALYLAWYLTYYTRAQISLTLGFATLFFAIFAIAPVVAYNSPESQEDFQVLPHAIAFLNAIVYFLEVYSMMDPVDKTASAWFALALAIIYIFLSRQAQAREAETATAETLHFLHLALAIGFLTIAIPIRLEAHWITVGWFVESAVLLWVAARVKSDFLNALAVVALALGTARLLIFDNFSTTRVIFNARAATYAVAIGVLGLVAWFASQRSDEPGRSAFRWSVIALNLLALTALSLEVNDHYARQLATAAELGRSANEGQWPRFRNITTVRDFTYSFLWMAYGAVLMVIGFSRRSAFVRWQALILIALTVAKVFTYDVSQLDRGYRIVSFIVLGILLLAISFAYQRDWFKLAATKQTGDLPAA